MAKPVLMIDIKKDGVFAGLYTPGRTEPSGFFNEALPLSADGAAHIRDLKHALSQILHSIQVLGFKDFESVLVSIPATDLSIRMLTIPFDERDKILEALPFELTGLLPFEPDDAVLDAIPLGNGKALAAAVEKKVLREYLEAFTEAGLEPSWIGSSLLSMPLLFNELYGGPGAKAFINRESITVSEEGRLKFFKPVKRVDGLRLALTYLEAEGIALSEVYSTGWPPEDLAALLPDIKTNETIVLPGNYPPEGAGVYALFLTLKGRFLEDTLNFRKGEFEYTKEKIELKRKLKFTAIALSVILVLIASDVYIRYLTLANELAAYKETLRVSYLQLFPGEKDIGDEVYQLEAKVKALQKDAEAAKGGFSPLNVMNSMAREAGSVKARLNDISIANGRVTAKGEAESFEGANRLKSALSKDPLFTDAKLTDVKARAGGGATFSIAAVLRD